MSKVNGKYKQILKDFIDTFYGKETVFYDDCNKKWYSRLTGDYHDHKYISDLVREIQEYYIECEEVRNK
ncbi:hypothetical protein BCB4_0229 [Bacillus phage B4]|uniref:Uncharacterized protein n=2 Tax=Bequatrovirus B4 TaxID=1918005 RepID=J9PQW2_9CAUD|nr:hypothetical protein BCB4_0229 [Bacillus phage B4]YP_009783819.1 hypothetical protein QLX26_gp223 [Bacillus phage B5S]AEW47457.1 hypothetical protein B5S_0223 [Bacillus phage B5S]AEZ66022.1 hypothetical protein BCB4_0229 [Bacillus phage B4]